MLSEPEPCPLETLDNVVALHYLHIFLLFLKLFPKLFDENQRFVSELRLKLFVVFLAEPALASHALEMPK